MLKLETIKQALSDRNAAELARRTGLSIHTVLKMQKGKFDNLRSTSVVAVSEYLKSTGVQD